MDDNELRSILREELGSFKAEVREEVSSTLAVFKGEMREEFGSALATFKGEMREEVNISLATFKGEIREEFGSFKAEMHLSMQASELRVARRMDALDGRMSFFGTRMDALDKRMGTLDKRMDGFDEHMGTLDKRMDALQKNILEVKDSVNLVDKKVDLLDQRVVVLHKDVDECTSLLQEAVVKFQEVQTSLFNLENKVDDHHLTMKRDIQCLDSGVQALQKQATETNRCLIAHMALPSMQTHLDTGAPAQAHSDPGAVA